MKRKHLLLALATALGTAAAGCGDNSKQCGPGTSDVNGTCTPDGSDVVCTDGTKLNDEGTGCEIDPNACQDGTVLVDGACVDTGRLDVDVEEAGEPNGLGLFGEISDVPAGDIVLKAGGEATVLHGTIVPHADADGDGQPEIDIDTFTLDVTAPILLEVSADGLNGLAAGFVSVAAVGDPNDPLAAWQRFGINVTGDTSVRQLYIPAPGQYVIAIADTRSLFLTGAAAGASEGPDFEYYVSITTQTISPTALTVTDGAASDSGTLAPGEVKLFSVPMGEGVNNVTYDVDATQAVESLVVANTSGGTTSVRAVVDETADEDTGAPIAPSAAFLGIRAGDTTLVAADHFFNYATGPVPYTLEVTTREAGALSTNGGDVSQPSTQTDFSTFFYDVVSDNELTGMDLSFDRPVSGVVVDENLFILAQFTFDPFAAAFLGDPFAFGDTFQDYLGLLRHPVKGRYYFLVFDPLGDTDTPLTATSTYTPVAAVSVVKGTPLTGQEVNAFASNPFTYAAGVAADAWQQFNASGTGTGTIFLQYFNPADTFGRMDPMTCGNAGGGAGICSEDVFSLFDTSHDEDGSVTVGRILLDDPTQNYLVTAHTATGGTFDLDFQRRANFTDFGTVAGGDIATADAQALDTAIPEQLFLLRTEPDSTLDVTISPNDALLDTRFQQLENDESNRGDLINTGILGADDVGQILQSGEGWTAIRVTGLLSGIAAGTFDLAIAVTPPPYSITAGTTPFVDACAGGAEVDLDDLDEGESSVIDAPAGFTYFGLDAPQLKMFSNGFLTFDTGLTCADDPNGLCFFANTALKDPDDPNALVAAYWDDLVLDSACSKTDGTKLILQWTGARFDDGSAVAFQAILDGSDGSIEFVYDASQDQTGDSATIGLEDAVGTTAVTVGVNTAGAITPGASLKLTPN